MNSQDTAPPKPLADPHIAAIDGLRALAVISVIVFHLAPNLLPGGFAGVDIFFVISGYVVTRSLLKQGVESFARIISEFYVRRISRIYPALLVCLLVTGILVNLFVPSSYLSDTSRLTGLYAFFGLSNVALVSFNDGYFSPRLEYNPYGHTWSLAVEEQFYFLFPIVLFIYLRQAKARKPFSWPLGAIIALTLGSLIFSAWQTSHDLDRAYFMLPSRFWELGAGAILCLLHSGPKKFSLSPRQTAWLSWTSLTLMVGGAVLSQKDHFPFPWALISVGGSVAFIACAVQPNPAGVIRAFGSRAMTYLGRMSYSLYLWHFPVIVLAKWTFGLNGIIPLLACLTITGLAAWISFKFIEPCGKLLRSRTPSNRWALVTGAFVIVFASGVSRLTYKFQPWISRSVTANESVWSVHEILPGSTLQGTPAKEWSNRTLFVIGDSHALAYSEMLRTLSFQTGVTIRMENSPGCGVESLLRPSENYGQPCVNYVSNTVAKVLKESKAQDLVFLASLRMNRLGDQWVTHDMFRVAQDQMLPQATLDRTKGFEEADRIVAQFESKGVRVLLDAPKPVFPSPAYRCADWYDRSNPICEGGLAVSRSFLLDFRSPVMKSIAALTSRHKNLLIWDPFESLCQGPECKAFRDGEPLFFDSDHLSGYGDRVLYPDFLACLTKVWQNSAENGKGNDLVLRTNRRT